MKNAYGFTLMEVLIVMIIASVLGIASVAGWQGWQQRQRLNDAARQIQLFLLRQRSEANWLNESRLLWAKKGDKWCLGSGKPLTDCSGKSPRWVNAAWQGITLLSLTDDVGFYGRRNVAKPGRVVIAGAAGERHIIISSRGRVRVCQPEGEGCL
ncbi:prepilin-type N-terminal cleavage/methylation domain-containing protein [Erwinia sp. 9145]|uniref:prepilin-type N-terminal cleavage/methylation domain-containing protein n=1 Tax=Erwinia sp. 9145 TaxID=1500895 RepID=UPI00054D2745|nr:prepilin-type N-terminal cleavage/methylation domain-containing protein [Erwinia sp. 9145]